MIYPKRYANEPVKRKAYEVACDLIAVYGVQRKSFPYKELHISRSEMKEIWNFAYNDMQGKSRYDFIV